MASKDVSWFKDRAGLVIDNERAQVVKTLADMTELSRRSAEVAALDQQEAGITQSLTEPPSKPTLENGVSLRPQARPQVELTLGEGASLRPQARPQVEPTPVPEETTPEVQEGRLLPTEIPEDVKSDTGFLASVASTSTKLGIPEGELLRAMHFETGGTFSTSIKNPTGSATGLIQFIESTAKGLGTSTAALAKMTREEQMVYVEKYLTPYKGRMKDFGDVYMAIHLPVAVGKDDDYVIYNNTNIRTQAYKQNKPLDLNKDGKVTRGEAIARAARDTKPKEE